ncbi:MAG: Cytochrome, partial [Rhizobacter sp.]|nr:Cytochrome [Rhizobacter sp.]
VPASPELHSLLWNAHQTLAFCFFALILVHLAAGLFHALVRRDGVYEAMAPYPVDLPVSPTLERGR